jgi:hypothetical protein
MHMYMLVWFMVFNATFNNISFISLRSVLLEEETGIPGENHRAVAIHWQTISYCCIAWVGFELTTLVGIGADCIDGSVAWNPTYGIASKMSLRTCFITYKISYIGSKFSWYHNSIFNVFFSFLLICWSIDMIHHITNTLLFTSGVNGSILIITITWSF